VVRDAFPMAGKPEGREMRKAPNTYQASGASGEQLTFLPPPPFCPTWPTRGTLADRALSTLMDGRTLDHLDFIQEVGSWRLAAYVSDLKDLGWPVETIEVPSPTEQCPDRVIALYRLDGKYTAQALAMNGGAA
jgi:hypothetical protein